METLLWAILLVSTSFLDAMRDTHIGKPTYHRWKWAAFYPVLIAVLVTQIPKLWWAPVALASLVAWQAGKRVGGQNWKSMWVRLVEKLKGGL